MDPAVVFLLQHCTSPGLQSTATHADFDLLTHRAVRSNFSEMCRTIPALHALQNEATLLHSGEFFRPVPPSGHGRLTRIILNGQILLTDCSVYDILYQLSLIMLKGQPYIRQYPVGPSAGIRGALPSLNSVFLSDSSGFLPNSSDPVLIHHPAPAHRTECLLTARYKNTILVLDGKF